MYAHELSKTQSALLSNSFDQSVNPLGMWLEMEGLAFNSLNSFLFTNSPLTLVNCENPANAVDKARDKTYIFFMLCCLFVSVKLRKLNLFVKLLFINNERFCDFNVVIIRYSWILGVQL